MMASLSAEFGGGLLRAHHDRRSAASAEISDDHPSINCLRWRSGNSARVCCDVALALAAPILLCLSTTFGANLLRRQELCQAGCEVLNAPFVVA